MASGFGENATYQFYRTERWLGRLEAIYCGAFSPIGNSDDLLDHFLAFFLNCYHVKDWLKKGPEWHDEVDRKVKGRAIEQFITETEALSVCADLCNGIKHFRHDQDLRSGGTPKFHGSHFRVDLTGDAPVRTVRFALRTSRGIEDAYTLAEECLAAWRRFIRESTTESLQLLAARNPRHGRKYACER